MTTTSLEIQLKLKNRHGVQRTLTSLEIRFFFDRI
ncbi:cellulose binding domain-containing protein [Acinetobacter junii]